MIKKNLKILLFIFGIFLFPKGVFAQVDFNAAPNDDLGNVTDEFQELFYEALKQKAIENYDKAIIALQKCIDMDDSKSILYYELGKNYNKLKNFGAAEDALKEAVNKEPDNEWYLDELYESYAQQKDYDKAIKTIKQLVKYHPDYKEDLASLYVRTKKYKDAIKVLDDLDDELGVSDQRDRLRNQIYNATGQKKQQIKKLEERVDDNPEAESNYLALIFRYSENNDPKRAFETAKKLLEVHPESQLVHLALYKFYLDDNKAEMAIESMKIVLNSRQIKPEAKLKVLTDFVNFVNKNPKYEKDLVEITTLVTESAADTKTFVEIAQYYLAKKDNVKAIEYYKKAQDLEPDNFGILRNIILLHIDLNEFDIAKQKSAEGIEKYPSQPVLYLINGVALNQLKEYNNAIEILETGLDYIIEDAKMEADFYKQLSKSFTGLNNLAKAKTFSDKAKALEISN
ncbi:tetratricopeptide repeat protein [Lacinutrix venerupis]|uniref:tetratricopeptide repeat protein n=1 Tax=Lacinutrix venerupis TaxID=1486034 RepID=UPI000EB5900F|nr:tetratricopeptide repeat protein [Lacinutrix venerupis]RLJ63248.1 tetratricopeptide repeat protein [Lacinutrix venerupis]